MLSHAHLNFFVELAPYPLITDIIAEMFVPALIVIKILYYLVLAAKKCGDPPRPSA